MTTTSSRTHVVLVLDETGSMEPIREQTVGALKEWLSGLQADLPGDTPVTFVRFNSAAVTRAIDGARLDDLRARTFDDYAPNHMTPLYDAVGQTLLETERRVRGDDGVIFTIMTDGQENSSREFSAEQVRELVERLKTAGWRFMFLGADIDAYDAGRHMGFAAAESVSMKKTHMRAAFATVRGKAAKYDEVRRARGTQAAAAETEITADERSDMGE